MQQRSLLHVPFLNTDCRYGRLLRFIYSAWRMTPGEYSKVMALNWIIQLNESIWWLIGSKIKGFCSIALLITVSNIKKSLNSIFRKLSKKKITPIWHQQIAQWFKQDFRTEITAILQEHHFSYKYVRHCLIFPKGSYNLSRYCWAMKTQSVRAVAGCAIGRKSDCVLIPCHRVIRATGMVGEYHWQKGRKIHC